MKKKLEGKVREEALTQIVLRPPEYTIQQTELIKTTIKAINNGIKEDRMR